MIKKFLWYTFTLKIPCYLFKLQAYFVVNHLFGKITAQIGKNNNIHPTVILREARNIIIGNNNYFNHNNVLHAGHGTGKLIIGNNVLTGPNVAFFVHNHNFENPDIPINKQGYYEEDIIIEDDVWIGCGSVITSGVTIGRGSIIGAGSVVTKSIPPYSIAVGAPAKVVKKRN